MKRQLKLTQFKKKIAKLNFQKLLQNLGLFRIQNKQLQKLVKKSNLI